MMRRVLVFFFFLLLLGGVLLLFRQGQLMPASLLLISMLLIGIAIDFEARKVSAQELVVLALLGSLAAASRIPFAMIPSLQPVSFIVMASSAGFGRRSGFIVGALAAFLSNFFLGQGPWTPWQMIAWALCGLLLPRKIGKGGLIVYGLLVGLLFGWFMNAWMALSTGSGASFGTWIALNIASFPMDLTHGLGNIFLILLFWEPLQRILRRARLRYSIDYEK